MDIINLRNKLWTLYSDYIKSDRLLLYNEIQNNFSQCKFNTIKRIGMLSTMAEIAQLSLFIKDKQYLLAVKLLPIRNHTSYIDNQKEFELAVLASNLVLEGKSTYFPLVYNFGEINPLLCKETYYYGSSDPKLQFYESSLRYQQFKQLIDSVNDESIKSQILSYKKKFMNIDYIKNILNLNEIIISDKVSSHLLFSELAPFDLEYYLDNHSLDNKQIYYLLTHIFLAIQDLHTKLNIAHLDLHLGNILMINNDNSEIGYIPLIHDFGKSKEIKFINDKPYFFHVHNDIFYFIGKFIEKLKLIYEDAEERFKSIFRELDELSYISESKNTIFPIIPIVEYWKNLKM